MTTGALIFAFDNENTKYLDLAAWSAERVKRFLDIPVAVVTNRPKAADSIFDHVIQSDSGDANSKTFDDYGNRASWHNTKRTDAYELTPFEKTLVLDADFVVNSDMLSYYFHADVDFICHKDAFSIDQKDREYLTDYNTFGAHRFPMWWATVMLFRKSNTAAYIFDCMNMVRSNWKHYIDLYNIQSPMYRNDFALSIALGIVSGHTLSVDTFNFPLLTVLPTQRLECNEDEMWIATWEEQGRTKSSSFSGLDFHAMCKRDLGEIVEAHRRARLCDSSS